MCDDAVVKGQAAANVIRALPGSGCCQVPPCKLEYTAQKMVDGYPRACFEGPMWVAFELLHETDVAGFVA
jgi:hypothetical protein